MSTPARASAKAGSPGPAWTNSNLGPSSGGSCRDSPSTRSTSGSSSSASASSLAAGCSAPTNATVRANGSPPFIGFQPPRLPTTSLDAASSIEGMTEGLGGTGDFFGRIPLFREFARLMATASGPVNWELARQVAVATAAGAEDLGMLPQLPRPAAAPDPGEARSWDDRLRLAELWVDPVTSLPAPGVALAARPVNRPDWAEAVLGGFAPLVEPGARRVAEALGHRGRHGIARGRRHGRPGRGPGRRAPGRHPGRPARPLRARPVRAGHAARRPGQGAAGPRERRRVRAVGRPARRPAAALAGLPSGGRPAPARRRALAARAAAPGGGRRRPPDRARRRRDDGPAPVDGHGQPRGPPGAARGRGRGAAGPAQRRPPGGHRAPGGPARPDRGLRPGDRRAGPGRAPPRPGRHRGRGRPPRRRPPVARPPVRPAAPGRPRPGGRDQGRALLPGGPGRHRHRRPRPGVGSPGEPAHRRGAGRSRPLAGAGRPDRGRGGRPGRGPARPPGGRRG